MQRTAKDLCLEAFDHGLKIDATKIRMEMLRDLAIIQKAAAYARKASRGDGDRSGWADVANELKCKAKNLDREIEEFTRRDMEAYGASPFQLWCTVKGPYGGAQEMLEEIAA